MQRSVRASRGVQHFRLAVQNMDRAFALYTEVLGGNEVMRDGDFQGAGARRRRPYGDADGDSCGTAIGGRYG